LVLSKKLAEIKKVEFAYLQAKNLLEAKAFIEKEIIHPDFVTFPRKKINNFNVTNRLTI